MKAKILIDIMKVTAIGADISNNDVSCSPSLIENLEKDIPNLLELGAEKAALTNITGDDVAIAAFCRDELLEKVNAGIVEILRDNAEDLGDLNGISTDPAIIHHPISDPSESPPLLPASHIIFT